ncbi:MAG: peptide deformylase [Burkholderiales bacterium]|nr:peptide deformylase [Burkholderiales bacterium]
MIKEVLTVGDERLLQVSVPLAEDEFNTQQLNALIEDMYDTMRYNNGVGISAVQIGVRKRIALIEYDNTNPRYLSIGYCPLTVVINPEIEIVGNERISYNEGCLSIPEVRGSVSRPLHLRYKFYDQLGKLTVGDSNAFFARVIQHEIDHMNGILFPARIHGKIDD